MYQHVVLHAVDSVLIIACGQLVFCTILTPEAFDLFILKSREIFREYIQYVLVTFNVENSTAMLPDNRACKAVVAVQVVASGSF